jgi:hypothetical protein
MQVFFCRYGHNSAGMIFFKKMYIVFHMYFISIIVFKKIIQLECHPDSFDFLLSFNEPIYQKWHKLGKYQGGIIDLQTIDKLN